jgi:hypothetical protein
MDCYRAGLPFKTRLLANGGLTIPSGIHEWPHFICEACTVRSVVDRELSWSAQDTALLMFERVRTLDMLHKWAPGTHRTYHSKIRVFRAFERDLGVPVLPLTPLLRPPNGPSIPLMWAQERYSLYPARWTRNAATVTSSVAWGSIRAMRSAASQFFALDLLTAHPEHLVELNDKPIFVNGCSPTDELSFTHFTAGMKRRIGEHSKPATPLLESHVRWIEDLVENQFRAATNARQRRKACRIAITNLIGWLAWLRASETFSLQWKDIENVPPALGPRLGLPEGVGVVLLRLLAQTKSAQSRTADVVVAYTTASGLSLGKWLTRLQAELGSDWSPDSYLLCHENGRAWTSHHYRHTYMLPFLETQRQLGDPFLAKFDGSPGNSIADKFWSFHAYRRGARTHVSRKRATNRRKATDMEVNEHGRWRRARGSMRMATAYLEWSFEDRVMLTVLCM